MIVAPASAGRAPLHAQRITTGPAETGPGSLAAARRFLEGRWGLLSFELVPEGEPRVPVPGEGSLHYDAFGNLDVEIRIDANAAERLEALGVHSENGRITTRGRTVIDMQGHTLTYVLDARPAFGAASGPLALHRKRHWEVEGSVLTLTTRTDDGQTLSIARWEKLP
jgi:hypothetical protein